MIRDNEKQSREDELIAYFHGELDDEEMGEVDRWLAEDVKNKELYHQVCRGYYFTRWSRQEASVNAGEARERVRLAWTGVRFRWQRYAVAAAVVLLLGGGWLVWFTGASREEGTPVELVGIEGVQSRAFLILSGGEKVTLQDRQDVRIVERDSSVVVVDSTGGICYAVTGEGMTGKEVLYNTLVVPRGSEYFVSLSDGTRVWLGADTRFEYPVAFGAGERSVRLKGEAYFEVASDSLHPFVVNSGDYRMQVYGTEFNLNTYDETRVQLVLVEGSVGFRANTSAGEVRLKPGQLGEVNVRTGQDVVRDVEVAQYVSWKEGTVIFADERLESIMEKLGRWYDVEVFFEREELKNIRFYGNLRRYEGIDGFLSYMEKTSRASFSVKGRTIVVGSK